MKARNAAAGLPVLPNAAAAARAARGHPPTFVREQPPTKNPHKSAESIGKAAPRRHTLSLCVLPPIRDLPRNVAARRNLNRALPTTFFFC